jgi:hypothetical protein
MAEVANQQHVEASQAGHHQEGLYGCGCPAFVRPTGQMASTWHVAARIVTLSLQHHEDTSTAANP